MNGINII